MTDQDGWKGRAPTPSSPGGWGPLLARLVKIEARLNNVETRSALTSASISSGGLTIRDGGGITVNDGGQIIATSDDGDGYVKLAGGGLEFEWGGAATPARVRAGAGDSGRTALWIYPPRDTGTTDPTSFYLEGPSAANVGGAALRSNGQILLAASTDVFALADNDAWLQAQDGTAHVQAQAGDVQISAGGKVAITSGDFTLTIPWSSMSAAANMYLDSDGRIWKVSSSLRYKQDVEDYSVDPADVLKLRPRTWRDKGEVERDPTTTNRYVGFIAEEVNDAGLTALVVKDEDGNPDSLSYDRMLAAYHALIAQQQQTITDLTARVAALEDKTTQEAS